MELFEPTLGDLIRIQSARIFCRKHDISWKQMDLVGHKTTFRLSYGHQRWKGQRFSSVTWLHKHLFKSLSNFSSKEVDVSEI